jgi:hypothetical protein
MTWGRGFFRVWLFLSAIWVGLSVYIAELKTFTWLWRAPIVDFQSPSGRQVSFNTSKSSKQLAEDVDAVLKREAELAAGLPPGFVLDHPVETIKPDALLKVIAAEVQRTGEEARRAWLATLVPPVVLLGLGLSVGWILRGFRARKTTST